MKMFRFFLLLLSLAAYVFGQGLDPATLKKLPTDFLADLQRRLFRPALQPSHSDQFVERTPALARLGQPLHQQQCGHRRGDQGNAAAGEWRPVFLFAQQRLGG